MKKKETPLPEGDLHDIANKFITFFSDKIKMITYSFPSIEYKEITESSNTTNTLSCFASVTDEAVTKVIQSGNSKCCRLDPIHLIVFVRCSFRRGQHTVFHKHVQIFLTNNGSYTFLDTSVPFYYRG